jgi:ATP-dependent helicase/nuclease subunit A
MSVAAPTPEQRAAIDARDTDVLCEAGAGTGKTRVLVGRYCDAIELDELGIDSILAFTFTERAAAELRTRIRRELARRASVARERRDAGLAERLNRASRETEGAWVTTIHGFCHRVLAAHPAAAGIDPRFRVLDHGEASRLRLHARDHAVTEVAATGSEAVGVIAAYQSRRIGEMAVAAYERLRSQGMSEPRLPPAYQPVRSIRDPDSDEPELSPVDAAGALAARRTLALVVEAFGRRYSELKTERSGLDFADLELGALALLRGSPAVSASWRARFRHLLVDEFQDTNAVQLELVEALRGPETRVFRVGDELQSIYRFRNADLAVFRDQRERANADPSTAVLPLTGNFRARPEIVAAVNALGTALLGDGFTALAAKRDPLPAEAPPPVELLLTLDEGKRNGWTEHTEALSPPPSETQAKLVAEALALALRLRELVDAGAARPRDIVVLLRAFTHVDAYEDALERAGLDPYVVGGRGYWSQQQVEDLLRLLECVANPLDDEMLLGALACPATGVSPDALWLLRRAIADDQTEDRARRSRRHLWPLIEWRFGDSERLPEPLAEHWLDAIPAEDCERLRRFCSLLAELRAAAPVLGLDQLVERTMTAFDYDLELLRRPRGAGRMANVRKLTRLALEFEAHEGRDLRGFLTSARELTERDEREGLAAVQAEDHDGVRIMTVHAAKGLEFPVVAVPDLARGLAQGERPGDVVIGRLDGGGSGAPAARMGLRLALPAAKSFGVWEFHELNEENVVEAAEEGARLVHVAATRAQERLILSGAFKPDDLEPNQPAATDSALRRLLPALRELGWNGGDGGVEIAASRLEVRISAPGAERATLLATRREAAHPPAEATAAAAPPLGRPDPVVPAGHLSYSALADYKSCAYRFHVERMLGMAAPAGALHPEDTTGAGDGPEAAKGSARDARLGFGNAVHGALERSAARAWEAPGDGELAELLAAEGVDDPAELTRARAMVDGWLGSELLAELRGSGARAEVPFALEIGGAIARGQIDLLVDAPPTVIDFKTDRLGDAGAADLAGRYDTQRALYALALASARADRASPEAVRAIHVFLEAPDEPVVESFDGERLGAARETLERLIAGIRAGRFEPTAEPSHSVCFGCPAAERLCPHPKWKPGWT